MEMEIGSIWWIRLFEDNGICNIPYMYTRSKVGEVKQMVSYCIWSTLIFTHSQNSHFAITDELLSKKENRIFRDSAAGHSWRRGRVGGWSF